MAIINKTNNFSIHNGKCLGCGKKLNKNAFYCNANCFNKYLDKLFVRKSK